MILCMAVLANKYNQWKFLEQSTTEKVKYSKFYIECKEDLKRQGYQTVVYKNEIMEGKINWWGVEGKQCLQNMYR